MYVQLSHANETWNSSCAYTRACICGLYVCGIVCMYIVVGARMARTVLSSIVCTYHVTYIDPPRMYTCMPVYTNKVLAILY